jgi:hypothetical protein|tara:strand:- start:53 stop:241 length:189 start_codon:yes stop_codon:yes gene_type:complete
MSSNRKYLIKLWKYASSDYVTELDWVTEKKAEDFIKEVSESLPKGLRATIEEKNERADKTTR